MPAMSATPAGSTSSMYWREGHRSLGSISIRGLAACIKGQSHKLGNKLHKGTVKQTWQQAS